MPITYDPNKDAYVVGRKGNLKIQPSVGGQQTGGPTIPDFSRVILPSKPRKKPYAPCKFVVPPITQRPKKTE